MSIIKDFCDQDLYKFSMGQVAFSQFPDVNVKYRYTNRAKDKSYRPGFAGEVISQIQEMSRLSLSPIMYEFFIKNMPWIKKTYLQWLRQYRYDPQQVNVSQNSSGELQIGIEGPWFETIFWEVPLLSIITELSNKDRKMAPDWKARIAQKGEKLSEAGVNWMDFGTRRRASFEVQNEVCRIMKMYWHPFRPLFRGTSNVFLAQQHGITAHGTAAHELMMIMQCIYSLQECNSKGLEHWIKEFRGNLGIALMDTITTPLFLEVFDSYFARLFDGVRQDSGVPEDIGEMVIKHYQSLRIDPTSKILVFSDSLNTDKAIALHKLFRGRIKTLMGIGTHLTNDVGLVPSNHVIKAVEANSGRGWTKLLKLSDDAGKVSGGDEMALIGKKILGLMAPEPTMSEGDDPAVAMEKMANVGYADDDAVKLGVNVLMYVTDPEIRSH